MYLWRSEASRDRPTFSFLSNSLSVSVVYAVELRRRINIVTCFYPIAQCISMPILRGLDNIVTCFRPNAKFISMSLGLGLSLILNLSLWF